MGGWVKPSASEIPLLLQLFYLSNERESEGRPPSASGTKPLPQGDGDLISRHFLMGSSAGAAHLLNNNAGVLR